MFLIYFILFLYLVIILFSWIQYQIKLYQTKQIGSKEEVKKDEFSAEQEESKNQKFEEISALYSSEQDLEINSQMKMSELLKEGEAINLLEQTGEKKPEEVILTKKEDELCVEKETIPGQDLVKGIILSEILGLPRAKRAYKYKR